MNSHAVSGADDESVSTWAESRKKLLETECSEQSEVGAFCSQGLLLHTFTSLFDTLATFNMNIRHCNIINMTENK